MQISPKLENLHRALGDAHLIMNGFNKFLDLTSSRGPCQPISLEMKQIAQETCAALDTMIVKNSEIIEDVLRTNSISFVNSKKESFEDLLDFSWNEDHTIEEDILMKESNQETKNAPELKQKRHGRNILHYVTRWIQSYLLHNFHFMQNQLSTCVDKQLKSDYIEIASLIERRFERIFCGMKKTGRTQIVSTFMAPRVFEYWLSFQYFRNTSLRFERTWDMQLGYSYWEHSVILDVTTIPVFLTQNYYWHEYKVANETTKLIEYYRMYAFRMEFEYEVDFKTLTIVASIRKEKFSTINRIWEECS